MACPLTLCTALIALIPCIASAQALADWAPGHVIVNPAVRSDRSAPLATLPALWKPPSPEDRPHHTQAAAEPALPEAPRIPSAGAAIEQTTEGTHPSAPQVASFDGLGVGFTGPQGNYEGRNPSDDSLAVGPDHVVQIVNSRLAVYSKQGRRFSSTGQVLFGAVVTNTLFAGFSGPCEHQISGDAVVRYDQLAKRWLFVVPIFRRPAPNAPYAMCYAVSAGTDPLGSYYRYEFSRPLFPDYPRPAIWPDGYYLPTSTGDEVIQKQVCAADRASMLRGRPAREQCFVIDGVNFLNNADVDGRRPPPHGMPNIVMAAGGTQLHRQFEDDGVYVWRFHVDWHDTAKTKLSGPEKIAVAPYHYLCDGQLSRCVPQPGTDVRLDAQGDKLMQRLVYRNFGGSQSIVAVHSVATSAGGGGVRWYEFHLDRAGHITLAQQGTYAPGGGYRWLGSGAMDRKGDIAIGYSWGGRSNFVGQRFAARLASDPAGNMTLQESVLAEGQAAQKTTLRWEDYTTLAVDPSDDCTFWYVGDYFKIGQEHYSTRIGAWRLPGCTTTRR